MKMSLHPETGPICELLIDEGLGGFGLKSQGVSAQINAFAPVSRPWNVKTFAVMPEGILSIQFRSKGLADLEVEVVHEKSRGVSRL